MFKINFCYFSENYVYAVLILLNSKYMHVNTLYFLKFFFCLLFTLPVIMVHR